MCPNLPLIDVNDNNIALEYPSVQEYSEGKGKEPN